MCGIAGIFNISGLSPERALLKSMGDAIAHRGPDGEGYFVEAGVGLAHRHLRIIDLSDAALQPMSNQDGTLQLILNGEIYNYVELRPELEAAGHAFKSHSDTEVLLNAYAEWGTDCLAHFNGMFAFALWDSNKRQLFIARDRLGVKPLYYWWDGQTLVFASEIKAILAHPAIQVKPHISAIAEYMSAMFSMGEHTWFEGVKQLLPGHFMTVGEQGLKIKQWWDLPQNEDEPGKRSEKAYVKRTRELLEDSVRLRLRADVPLGAHLSGGLDSSAVVALLSKRLKAEGVPVRTFSGAFGEGAAYDERNYVKTVVDMYRTDHHETLPTSTDLRSLMRRIVYHMDQPAAGPGILLQWAVCRITREAGVTVINGGQGGDEAWGGYFGYVPAYFATLLRQARTHPRLLIEAIKSMAVLLSRSNTRVTLLKALVRGRRARLKPTGELGPWAGPLIKTMSKKERSDRKPEVQQRHTPLSTIMYTDLKWYLPALLQVEDRTSMAFSLESRAPLLDYRLIEHSARVPSVFKMRGLDMKHVLKEAVRDLLPAEVYKRTDKMGMPTPVDIWFRGPLREWVREELTAPEIQSLGLLDSAFVEQTLGEHFSGAKDRSLEIWKMLNLVVWWRMVVLGEGVGESRRVEPHKTSIETAPETALVTAQ